VPKASKASNGQGRPVGRGTAERAAQRRYRPECVLIVSFELVRLLLATPLKTVEILHVALLTTRGQRTSEAEATVAARIGSTRARGQFGILLIFVSARSGVRPTICRRGKFVHGAEDYTSW